MGSFISHLVQDSMWLDSRMYKHLLAIFSWVSRLFECSNDSWQLLVDGSLAKFFTCQIGRW